MSEEHQNLLREVQKNNKGLHLDEYVKPISFQQIMKQEAASCQRTLRFKKESHREKMQELYELPFKILSNKRKVKIKATASGSSFIIISVIDVTAMKRYEKERSKIEERYQTIYF